jgi:hypothetical protein
MIHRTANPEYVTDLATLHRAYIRQYCNETLNEMAQVQAGQQQAVMLRMNNIEQTSEKQSRASYLYQSSLFHTVFQ